MTRAVNAKPTRAERIMLGCGAVGPPLFVVVFLIEAAFGPVGYDPLRHPISSYSISEYGWVQVANFLVTGTLMLAFAVGLLPAVRRYGGGIGIPLLMGLFAVGLVGSGLFATDPLAGYPPGTPPAPGSASRTIEGTLHDTFGIPVFLGLPILCGMLTHRFTRSGRPGWAGYSAATAVAFLAGFVVTSVAFAQQPALAPIGGLLQRLTIVIGWAWLTALALHLLRSTGPEIKARSTSPGRRRR